MDTASVTHWPLLSLLIWLPILGGVFTLMAGNARPQLARWTALVFALLSFALSIPLFWATGLLLWRLDMSPDRAVRLACRDAFRKTGLLARIIPAIEEVLSAGDLPRPDPPPEAMPVAFDDPASGDEGHRG